VVVDVAVVGDHACCFDAVGLGLREVGGQRGGGGGAGETGAEGEERGDGGWSCEFRGGVGGGIGGEGEGVGCCWKSRDAGSEGRHYCGRLWCQFCVAVVGLMVYGVWYDAIRANFSEWF
jgi:hypothetical protein